MAIKAPALPPTARTGLSEGGGQATGTPMSDSDMFSKLSAATGLDKIANPGDAPPEPQEPATDPIPAEVPDPTPDAPTEPVEPATATESAIDDLSDGLPDFAKAPKKEADQEPKKEEPKKPIGKDLRSQLEHFSAEAKALAKEKETLTKRLGELEAQVKESPNIKTLAEQLQKREEQIADLEKKVQYLDYTQSEDFQTRYNKPYETKLTEAYKKFSALTKEDGSKLTQPEIESLLLSNERDAYRVIEESFSGPDARLASRLVSEIYTLSDNREDAIRSAKTEAQTRTKQQQEQTVRFRELYKQNFEQAKQEIAKKLPELYQPNEKDPEFNQMLEAGYKLADLPFNNELWTKADPRQRAVIEAEIYHRAGALPAVRLRAIRAEKEVERLNKELARYKASSPGRGETPEEGIGGSDKPLNGIPDNMDIKDYAARGLRDTMKRVK